MSPSTLAPIDSNPDTAKASNSLSVPAPTQGIAIQRILLATAGVAGGHDAALTAFNLARRHGAAVSVISVFRPRVAYPHSPGDRTPPRIPPSDRPAADAQIAAVRRQVKAVGAESGQWDITLSVGHVGRCIGERAAEAHADLVVMGNGRQLAGDRHLGDRGAIAIAACLDGPLLAASSGFTGRPRRLLLTVGLDETTLAAIVFATALLPEPEIVFLAHVAPGTSEIGAATTELTSDMADREVAQFDAVRGALAPWPHTQIETCILSGDPVERILEVARDKQVDLIVGGLHGATYHEREHIRNIALHLLADAECSVLLVPLKRATASTETSPNVRATETTQ